MEFDFVVTSICRDLITVWDGTTIYHLSPDVRKQITAIINRMGAASSRAQGLGAIITTTSRLCMNVHTGQRLYLYRDPKNEKKVCGLLKIGRKKLFLRDNVGRMRELNASCVLDFYVHESCQRRGIGKALFQHMLKAEQLPAAKFAIDRPSHKFLAFLRKHYKLGKFTPQNNNFVVFDQYFKAKVKHRKESSKLNLQAFPGNKSLIFPLLYSYTFPSPIYLFLRLSNTHTHTHTHTHTRARARTYCLSHAAISVHMRDYIK